VDSKSLCNDKEKGGFGCINIKDFFTGLKLSWLKRYAIQQIDDHWCDILDHECGISEKADRIKILGWGAEFFTPIIKKKIPGISDFLQALQILNRNWITPKEEKDNRWLHQPIFYNCRIKMAKTKGFPKKLAYTTPELLGLKDTIKTRSIRVIDFLHNNNLLPDGNIGNRIVAHITGLGQGDFINTHAINQSFKKLFEPGQIFANHIPTLCEQPLYSYAEIKELFKATKKGSKNFRKELSKKTKVDMKLANWIKCLGDPTITNEEIVLCNKALNWTDLGHDNLDRLMRVYFKKTQFADQRKKWQPGTTGECKFCLKNNIMEPETLKHVLYDCQDTKKCLEMTLRVFGLPKQDEIKVKELILWKFINSEQNTRNYSKEIVFKTIITLFLCEYLKLRYSADNSAEMEAKLVVDNTLKQLNIIHTYKPLSSIMRAINNEPLIMRLLVSGFSPHID